MADSAVTVLFQTPLIEADVLEADAMNISLAQAIASRRSGMKLPPAMPWEDDTDLRSWAGEAAALLAEQAVALALRCSVDIGSPEAPRFTWRSSLNALAMPFGAYLPPAERPGAAWTVHYSIDPAAANEANGGLLLLQDPRMPTLHMVAPELRLPGVGGERAEEPLLSFLPARSRMMMVPGWLRAGISRYTGAGEQLWVIIHVFADPR